MISPRLVLAFLNLGLVTFANADVSAPTTEPAVQRRPGTLLAALDFNRDGILSPAEIANSAVTLAALDVDGDGRLSLAELRGEVPHRRTAPVPAVSQPTRLPRSGSGFTLAFTLDANRDGDIQMAEIANAAASLRMLDLNRDGQLTPEELRFDLAARSTALAAAN